MAAEASEQCPHVRGSGTRCQLPAGHDSHHRAWLEDDVVLSWVNWATEHAHQAEDDAE